MTTFRFILLVILLLTPAATGEARDELERTALHLAVGMGDVEALTLLLEHGADVEARTTDGRRCIGRQEGSAR